MNKRLISIIIAFIGLALITASISYAFTKDSNKEEEKKEEKKEENIEKDLTSEKAIKELDKYLTILQNGNMRLENIFDYSKFTQVDKVYFTLHYIFNDKNYKVITLDTVPDKYKDDKNFASEYLELGAIYEVTFNTFEKTYSTIFGENIKHDEEVIRSGYTSPCLGVYDTELKNMYFNSAACGEGISAARIYYAKEKYTEDNDYYYMYLYSGKFIDGGGDLEPGLYNSSDLTVVDVDKFEGNEDKFSVFVIKLDKNYKIIETKFA